MQKSSLNRHVRQVHRGDKPVECDSCGRPFSQVSSMKRHRKSHKEPVDYVLDGSRYKCLKGCGQRFDTWEELKAHLQSHADQQQEQLQTHAQQQEEGFKCQRECGQRFSNWEELNEHLQSHDRQQEQVPQGSP